MAKQTHGRSPRRWWRMVAIGLVIFVALLGAAAYAAVQLDMMPNPFPPQPAPYPAPADTRDGRWQQDLDYLVQNIGVVHRNAFWRVSREDFEAQAAALRAQIPTLADGEIMTRMAELLALIGDGHTRPYLHEYGFYRTFPIGLRWLGNDLVVMSATETYRDVIGGRVVQIGAMDTPAAMVAVTPLISIDNHQQLLARSPQWLTTPEALAAVDALDDAESGVYVVEMADGERVTLELLPIASDDAELEWVTIYEVLAGAPPLRMQNPNSYYWYTYLEETQALYFQYNICANDPEQSFADFNTEMFAFIDANPVANIVIDVRFNGGGNSTVLRPFIDAIKARPQLNTADTLSVLIGRGTFSSAVMNALQLDEETNARLIGEGTSGKPNHYGETRTFELPNSQIPISYSTRFFRQLTDRDPEALYPNWEIAMTWEDLLTGRDPVLEVAIGGV
ncbi:MAG: hypothetical protein SF123_20020 [Chloroflexota bacterium]|nr:hypothetical protein [Chloroflexota bacterium]